MSAAREDEIPMRLRAGSSGWSYPQWKGHFYPEKLAAKDMLHYYAERLATVEVNNTYYRMPKPGVLEGWAGEVPDGFSFVLKAPQQITHFRRLRDVGDAVAYFLKTAAVLGPKLGPIFAQLPPNMKKDVPLLADFANLIPSGTRLSIEFRNPSWFDDEVFALLRERGIALCVADTEKADGQLVPTADWGYARLRRDTYSDDELRSWAERLRAQPWNELFVFFKHEDEGAAAKLAMRLGELWTP